MFFPRRIPVAGLLALLLTPTLPACSGSSEPQAVFCAKVITQGRESGGPLAASGNFVYAGGTGSIAIFELSKRGGLVLLDHALAFPTQVDGLGVGGNRMVASGGNLVVLFDLTDPRNPVEIGRLNTAASSPNSVVINGNFAFVGTSSGNIGVIDVTGPAPKLINQTGGGPAAITGIAISGSTLYAGGGANSGMMVFDISDPAHPQQAPTIAVGPGGKIQGLAVDQGALFAFTFQGVGQMVAQRFDISSPLAPKMVATSTASTIDSTPGSAQVTTLHGLFIAGEELALFGWKEDKIADAPSQVGNGLCLTQPFGIQHALAVGDSLVISR
jgi:hypothetical protein